MKTPKISLAVLAATNLAKAALNDVISIDSQLTYRILPDFEGNVTENFVDTSTTNTTTSTLFAAARNATFISYCPDFLSLIGPNPSLQLITQRNESFANEAGIWVPPLNEVWFTSSTIDDVTTISVLSLSNLSISTPSLSQPIINANGGYYFDSKVYFASDGNAAVPSAIYSVDPVTGETEVLINSYFGLQFNGPNDITWVKPPNSNQTFMFFTDDPLSSLFDDGPPPVLVDAVWRFDPTSDSLVPVISRADILIPNGIATNKEQNKLFVTDSTPIDSGTESLPAGAGNSGSNAIYAFDLVNDTNGIPWPVNKRLFGISRTGIPDGIKVDDQGRVWTGEGEGIVVRDSSGKVLGLFNAETLLVDRGAGGPLANFALAGDRLVIEGNERLWILKLGETVMGPGRFEG
ncbi:calcium-dependent phosphotriesterase [Hyaloscypha variabilis]